MSTPEGKPKAEETPPPNPDSSADYATMAKENEMLKVRNKQLETQLRQAIDIAQRVKQREDAKDEALKEQLVVSIMQDSKFNKETLMSKTLDELRIIRTAIDNSIQKDFANVAAEIDFGPPKKANLTVGQWDAERKQWIGGR